MKVKIGETWFDAADFPILVAFDPEDLECLRTMKDKEHTFAAGPADMTQTLFILWCQKAKEQLEKPGGTKS